MSAIRKTHFSKPRLAASWIIAAAFAVFAHKGHAGASSAVVDREFSQLHIHNKRPVSILWNNPATAELFRTSMPEKSHLHLRYTLKSSVEYGNVDDLFQKIDEVSTAITTRKETTPSSSPANNGSTASSSDNNALWEDLEFDLANENLEQLTAQISHRAQRLAAVTALIATEGYATAELLQDIHLLPNAQLFGGSWKFTVSRHLQTAAIGIADEVDFDPSVAEQELAAVFYLEPTASVTEFDFSGGLRLTVDPALKTARVAFKNDSLLLTKAARVTDVQINYSSSITAVLGGELYWGINLKYRELGLTNLGFRIGDITDSEELFDTIDNAQFDYDAKFGADLGVAFVHATYSLGATVKNLFLSDFEFPKLNLDDIENQQILQRLADERKYESQPQLTLEASKFLYSGAWSISGAIDTAAVDDPLGQSFQWATLRTDFNFNNWMVSNINIGAHYNFSGSELSYVSLGLNFLKVAKLELASSLDNTRIDGTNLPRGLAIALSVRLNL